MKNKKVLGIFLMICTAIIFGLEMILQKLVVSNDVSPNSLNMYRMIFIVIILSIYLLLDRIKNKIKNKNLNKKDSKNIKDDKKEIKNISDKKISKQYKLINIGMALANCVNYFAFSTGISITDNVSVTEFINVVADSLFIILLLCIFIPKERKNLKNKYIIFAIIFTFVGIIFTNEIFKSTFDFNSNFNKGLGYILLADLAWATYILQIAKLDKESSMIKIVRDNNFLSLIIYGVVLLITNNFKEVMLISPEEILHIFIFMLIIDIGTIVTYYNAIRMVSGIIATIFTLSSPIITFICAYVILNERIDGYQLFGCVLLFIANILLSLEEIRKMKHKE